MLLAAAAVGYLFAPSMMLAVVGIEGTPETEFLVRTVAAAFIGMLPMGWATLRRTASTTGRLVLAGLALYMFMGSAVDLHAYATGLVGTPALPSIALRVILGLVLSWLALP